MRDISRTLTQEIIHDRVDDIKAMKIQDERCVLDTTQPVYESRVLVIYTGMTQR